MMTTFWRHWRQLMFLAENSIPNCYTTDSFYKCMTHEKDESQPNMPNMFALFLTDVNFAYWPPLQLLLSPRAYSKNGVF